MEKNCSNCEFNCDGICTGYGNMYKYGEKITDLTKHCDSWNASQEYCTYETLNAPRFLREEINECRITYSEFSAQFDDYTSGKSIPINFFDAIKIVYGISMVDLAVIMNVSFGVVYRAKTKGIPQKRISQFAEALCVNPDVLSINTTAVFEKLQESKKDFFAQANIQSRLNELPNWKHELANIISFNHLHCPIHIAKDIARVDKLYWNANLPMNDFTDSEKVLIEYVVNHNQYKRKATSLEYFLDIACLPHMRIGLYDSEK